MSKAPVDMCEWKRKGPHWETGCGYTFYCETLESLINMDEFQTCPYCGTGASQFNDRGTVVFIESHEI